MKNTHATMIQSETIFGFFADHLVKLLSKKLQNKNALNVFDVFKAESILIFTEKYKTIVVLKFRPAACLMSGHSPY